MHSGFQYVVFATVFINSIPIMLCYNHHESRNCQDDPDYCKVSPGGIILASVFVSFFILVYLFVFWKAYCNKCCKSSDDETTGQVSNTPTTQITVIPSRIHAIPMTYSACGNNNAVGAEGNYGNQNVIFHDGVHGMNSLCGNNGSNGYNGTYGHNGTPFDNHGTPFSNNGTTLGNNATTLGNNGTTLGNNGTTLGNNGTTLGNNGTTLSNISTPFGNSTTFSNSGKFSSTTFGNNVNGGINGTYGWTKPCVNNGTESVNGFYGNNSNDGSSSTYATNGTNGNNSTIGITSAYGNNGVNNSTYVSNLIVGSSGSDSIYGADVAHGNNKTCGNIGTHLIVSNGKHGCTATNGINETFATSGKGGNTGNKGTFGNTSNGNSLLCASTAAIHFPIAGSPYPNHYSPPNFPNQVDEPPPYHSLQESKAFFK